MTAALPPDTSWVRTEQVRMRWPRRRRSKPSAPNLHRQAAMEREVYGEVVSPSLRDLPPPNPFVASRR